MHYVIARYHIIGIYKVLFYMVSKRNTVHVCVQVVGFIVLLKGILAYRLIVMIIAAFQLLLESIKWVFVLQILLCAHIELVHFCL